MIPHLSQIENLLHSMPMIDIHHQLMALIMANEPTQSEFSSFFINPVHFLIIDRNDETVPYFDHIQHGEPLHFLADQIIQNL